MEKSKKNGEKILQKKAVLQFELVFIIRLAVDSQLLKTNPDLNSIQSAYSEIFGLLTNKMKGILFDAVVKELIILNLKTFNYGTRKTFRQTKFIRS